MDILVVLAVFRDARLGLSQPMAAGGSLLHQAFLGNPNRQAYRQVLPVCLQNYIIFLIRLCPLRSLWQPVEVPLLQVAAARAGPYLLPNVRLLPEERLARLSEVRFAPFTGRDFWLLMPDDGRLFPLPGWL